VRETVLPRKGAKDEIDPKSMTTTPSSSSSSPFRRLGTILLVIGLALVVLKTAFTPENQRLPGGTYQDASGMQRIIVRGEAIDFRLLSGLRTNVYFKSYPKHEVWGNGRIQPSPMASSDFEAGIGRYDWRWDGTGIVQKDSQSGDITLFSRRN
jgi:hypothetical protein